MNNFSFYTTMINTTEGIAANPLKLSFLVIIIMHILLAFFNTVIVLQLLSIIILIFIFSYALITIIFNLTPVLLTSLQRVNNILPAIILLMLTSFPIFDNTEQQRFNTEVTNTLLIFTLLIIGCIYIGFVLINTGFPKWHRQINILIGFFSIILSLITIIVPILGYTFLTIVICALVSIDKTKLLEFY